VHKSNDHQFPYLVINKNGSARQERLAARAERVANGGSISRGRPVNPTSARAMKIADRQAKLAAGIVVKPGRPAATTENAQ
jgi:hypothetical protein